MDRLTDTQVKLLQKIDDRVSTLISQAEAIREQHSNILADARTGALLDRWTERVCEVLLEFGIRSVAQDVRAARHKVAYGPMGTAYAQCEGLIEVLKAFLVDMRGDPFHWGRKLEAANAPAPVPKPLPPVLPMKVIHRTPPTAHQKIFLVHGQDHDTRDKIHLFLRNDLKAEVVVMEDEAQEGRTLAEKLEGTSKECGFAVIIASLDDNLRIIEQGPTGPVERPILRLRQNVILEIGFFWGKLGRRQTAILFRKSPGAEGASDLDGIGYIPITSDLGNTKIGLRKEIEAWRARQSGTRT